MQIKFADAYWGGSFDAMVREALGQSDGSEPPSPVQAMQQLAAQPTYPERDKAAVAAAAAGVMEQAIQRVLAYTYPDGVDASKLSVRDWMERMWAAEDEIRSVPRGVRVEG